MRFSKGHGTGNDFVILPDPDGDLELSAELVRALCDRRTGIGADGVLRVVLTAAVPEAAHLAGSARWFMDYRNADGSLAEMCGNGARVYARYLVQAGYAEPGSFALATRGGVREVVLDGHGEVTVDMGAPRLTGVAREVTHAGASWPGVEVWMGNPHVVAFVDDLDLLGGPLPAPAVRPHLDTNVEFVRVRRPGELAMRVHERGSGETASCGTGACAAAVAEAWGRQADGTDAVVDLPGGRLRVRWADGTVRLSGPAEVVAHGVLDADWLAARSAGCDAGGVRPWR